MSSIAVAIIMVSLTIILIFLGVHIGVTLLATSVLGIWLIGFSVSMTIFAFLYSHLHGGRWYLSLFIAFLCFVVTYGLFEMVIHAPWPEPFLLELIRG